MNIAGFNPNSFVDYPNNIAAVIFFAGCNFDCWYCHNKSIIKTDKLYSKDNILESIDKNKKYLDAVVITGGEPTLADTDELIELIKAIKAMDLLVKLDTNGTNYNALKKLLPYLDYVAMDIKAPLSKYNEITKITDGQIQNIKKSIKLLIDNIECEFRTTFIPSLSVDDAIEIAETVKGCKYYYIQQYNPIEGYMDILPHSKNYLQNICETLHIKGYPCELRNL